MELGGILIFTQKDLISGVTLHQMSLKTANKKIHMHDD